MTLPFVSSLLFTFTSTLSGVKQLRFSRTRHDWSETKSYSLLGYFSPECETYAEESAAFTENNGLNNR